MLADHQPNDPWGLMYKFVRLKQMHLFSRKDKKKMEIITYARKTR